MEELLENIEGCISIFDDYLNVKEEIDTFFDQNVVIPKGKNRHPFADVLHEWVEGGNIQYLGGDNEYRDALEITKHFPPESKYRVKPKEPVVYEWQWHVGFIYGINTITEGFHTEEEIGKLPYRKIEETKRVRQ